MSDRTYSHDPGRSPFAKLWKFFQRVALAPGFYGSVTVRIQNGRVCDVRLDTTKKLDDLDKMSF